MNSDNADSLISLILMILPEETGHFWSGHIGTAKVGFRTRDQEEPGDHGLGADGARSGK